MSWHLEFAGTKEQVVAKVEKLVASPSGMPADVGDYIKNAVNAVTCASPHVIYLRSSGHRPLEWLSGAEVFELKVLETAAPPESQ